MCKDKNKCECGCDDNISLLQLAESVFTQRKAPTVVKKPKTLIESVIKESVAPQRKLLVETFLFGTSVGSEVLNEAAQPNQPAFLAVVKGVIQRADSVNQNGRVYPRSVLEAALKEYDKKIRERRAVGELDHPDTMVVELKNTSHNIRRIWWEGKNVMAEIEILPTPSGKILKALIDCNILIGISSRGMASVGEAKEDGVAEVGDDFELLCWDFVSDPSTQGAFMREVKESKLPNLAKFTTEQKHNISEIDNQLREITCMLTGVCEI